MKKRYIIILLLLGAVLYFTWHAGEMSEPMPTAPETVTQLGQYQLDNHRAVEVREESGVLKYYEVTSQEGFAPKGDKQIVVYALNHIEDIKLAEGWSISHEKPSTVIINTGSGQTIHRKFGHVDPPTEPVVERTKVTRKVMVERFNEVIAGEPQVIPADQIESIEPVEE